MWAQKSVGMQETSIFGAIITIEGKAIVEINEVRVRDNQEFNITSDNIKLESSSIQANSTIQVFANNNLNIASSNMTAN